MDNETGRERRALDYLEKAWGQALLAVSNVEDEASKLVQKLAGVAGWSQDEVRRQVRELSERLANHRRDLEKTVEERVRAAVVGLRVPRREEIAELHRRVSAAAERLQRLTAK